MNLVQMKKDLEYLISWEKRERTKNLRLLLEVWPQDILLELVTTISQGDYHKCEGIIQKKLKYDESLQVEASKGITTYGYQELKR